MHLYFVTMYAEHACKQPNLNIDAHTQSSESQSTIAQTSIDNCVEITKFSSSGQPCISYSITLFLCTQFHIRKFQFWHNLSYELKENNFGKINVKRKDAHRYLEADDTDAVHELLHFFSESLNAESPAAPIPLNMSHCYFSVCSRAETELKHQN